MSPLKLVILPKQPRESGECRIYIRLIHNGKSARIKTKYFVLPVNWNKGLDETYELYNLIKIVDRNVKL